MGEIALDAGASRSTGRDRLATEGKGPFRHGLREGAPRYMAQVPHKGVFDAALETKESERSDVAFAPFLKIAKKRNPPSIRAWRSNC